MTVHLILGGARSGKSSLAENKARHLAGVQRTLHYVATAIAFDDEMSQRIAHHQHQRGKEWTEHESPYELAETLKQFTAQDVVLVDCLTLWMNNVIYNQGHMGTSEQIQQEVSRLVSVLEQTEAEVILVSNEVGLGIVPMGEVSRLFVDNAGWMNQSLSRIAADVFLVVAGIAVKVKH